MIWGCLNKALFCLTKFSTEVLQPTACWPPIEFANDCETGQSSRPTSCAIKDITEYSLVPIELKWWLGE